MTSRSLSVSLSGARSRRVSHLLIGSALALVAAVPAYAQEKVALNDGPTPATPIASTTTPNADDAPASEPSDQSDIVVTGTRAGARAADKSLVPISVTSAEDLERSGKQNLRDALADAVPSYSIQAGGYQGQQGAGVRGARLRGLDVKDTLVLVNGVRRHTSALYVGDGAPTDLDLIPSNAIDHIEILEDGAAAQYGSDAIAGVINIILKKTAITGGAFSAYYGQYGQSVGDLSNKYGRTKNLQLYQGVKLGDAGGFVNFSANLQWQNGTNDYPGYAPADITKKTTLLYPLRPDGTLDPRETSVSRYRQWLGLPSSRTFTFAYNAEIPISSTVTVYSNATYGWRYSSGPGYFRTASNQSLAASTTPSPQDPFANAPYTSGVLVFPDGYLPTFDDQENDYQAVLGVKGELAGWDWDISSSYGSNRAKIYTKNSINVSAGPDNWGQRNFYDGLLANGQLLTSLAASRKFQSGLFGHPLTVSAGFEHRYDTYKQGAGELLSYEAGPWVWPAGTGNAGTHPNLGAQGMAGFTPSQAGSWGRNNFAGYIELNQLLTDRWTVDLAGRYEYYTDFGSAPSGQLSTRYEFSDKLAVRGTIGNGFSAPTLQQKYYTTQSGSYAVDSNPLSPTLGQYIQQYSVKTTASQAIGQAIDIPQLKPEHSINASLGFVAKPFARTTLTIDGYLIDIKNRIVSASAAVTKGSALANILSAQNIYNVTTVSFNINGAHTFTKGFDVRLEHTDPLGDLGTLHWTLASNENVTSIVQFGALPTVIGAASAGTLRTLRAQYTTYYPRNVTYLSLGWELDKFRLYAKETHWGATEYRGASATLDQRNRPAFTTDANLSYAFSDALKLSIGGDNVFNKRPTLLSASAQSLQFISATAVAPYNSYAPFGQDGGFYYARLDVKW